MPKVAIKAYCLFINMQFSGHDITDDAEVSNIFLYADADDAKLFKHVQTPEDRSSLQNMLNNHRRRKVLKSV